MLSIAVCDDEVTAVRMIAPKLKREFESYGIACRFELFTNSRVLAERVERGIKYDVLFLDISMPQLDGIELGTKLIEQLSDTILIYISSREDLVFDAFQARPFRFVRKKRFQTDLPILVRDIFREIERRNGQKIPFQCGSSVILLQPEKILYAESYKKVQILHCQGGQYEVKYSFQKVMELLNPYGFVQAHKSFFVNCRYIHSISRTELILDDQTVIPIGRSKREEVKRAFSRFTMSNMVPASEEPAP